MNQSVSIIERTSKIIRIYGTRLLLNIAFCFSTLFFLTVSTAFAQERRDYNYILEDFPVNETKLTEDQKQLLVDIVDDIADYSNENHQPWCLHIVGHAATWRDISDTEYCGRSVKRARQGAKWLEALLKTLGHSVNVVTEDKARLGSINKCTPNKRAKYCKTKGNAKITIVYGGRADRKQLIDESGHLIDNMVHSSSAKAQKNRSRNRRIEISAIDKPPPKANCKVLKKDQMRDVAWAFLGRTPTEYALAENIAKYIDEGHNSPVCKLVRKRLGETAGIPCLFFERLADTYKNQFSEDGLVLRGALMGAAYAIVDGPDYDRSKNSLRSYRKSAQSFANKMEKGFRRGYSDMHHQLLAIQQSDTKSASKLKKIQKRIHCKESAKPKMVRWAFEALRDEVMNNGEIWGNGARQLSIAGKCSFKYRKASFSCGPL